MQRPAMWLNLFGRQIVRRNLKKSLKKVFISKYFFFFRYRAIMYPLKRKPTKLISKVVIIMIWICGFLFALPMAYAFTFDNVPDWVIPIPGKRHFKICLLWLLDKKECSFYAYLFWSTEIR